MNNSSTTNAIVFVRVSATSFRILAANASQCIRAANNPGWLRSKSPSRRFAFSKSPSLSASIICHSTS